MEVVMGSSMGAAAAAVVLGVPMNIVQGIPGIIVGAVLLPVLGSAQARRWARRFAHDKMDRKNGSGRRNRLRLSKNSVFRAASRLKPRFQSNLDEKPRPTGTIFRPLYCNSRGTRPGNYEFAVQILFYACCRTKSKNDRLTLSTDLKRFRETEPFFYATFDLLSCDSLWTRPGDTHPA